MRTLTRQNPGIPLRSTSSTASGDGFPSYFSGGQQEQRQRISEAILIELEPLCVGRPVRHEASRSAQVSFNNALTLVGFWVADAQ